MRRVRDDPRDRLAVRVRFARQHDRRCAVGNRARRRRGDRAVLGEGGAQCRDLVGLAATGRLVGIDRHLALARRHRHGGDLAFELAAVDRRFGAVERLERVIVHVLARQLIFVRRALREAAHRAAFLIGVFKPVEEHVVIGGVVADAGARTVLFEEVWRIGHRFHAARDDQVDRSCGQRLGAHDDRLHARTADLVDRRRLDRFGQAGLDRRLARGCLAEPGGQHAAHIYPVDVLAPDPGAFDRRLDRSRAEIGRAGIGERALHRPHRGARIGQDDD